MDLIKLLQICGCVYGFVGLCLQGRKGVTGRVDSNMH